jgi:hypothetical protein
MGRIQSKGTTTGARTVRHATKSSSTTWFSFRLYNAHAEAVLTKPTFLADEPLKPRGDAAVHG